MMASITEFNCYKTFVNHWISLQPKKGYGQYKKMAEYLGVHNVVVSQVFRGDRQLTPEQAQTLSDYLGLTELLQEYFLLLVSRARAGSFKLTKTYDRMLSELKAKCRKIENNVKKEEFTEEAKNQFYSEWYYSAIRLSCSLENINSIEQICDSLDLSRETVGKVLNFLIQNGLVVSKNNFLQLGPRATHLSSSAPQINQHRRNWRLQALDHLSQHHSNDIFYSGPMTLSKKDFETVRNSCVELIKKSTDLAIESKAENLACLNVDWFSVSNK